MSEAMMNLVVAGRAEQADGIVVLDLASQGGDALPSYDAGAHIDVVVGPDLVRQYSLCGNPADRSTYRLGILLDPKSRGGSAAIHRSFRLGETVRVSAPRNHFPLHEPADYSVLIGGGIGVTPIIAMAYDLARRDRPFEIHYCAKQRTKAVFLDELEAEPFRDKVKLHFSAEPDGRRMQIETDLPAPRLGIHLYVCGPTPFMEAVIGVAKQLGYTDDQIHREYFNAEVDASGGAFDVVLSQSGRTISVPSGMSIVKALAAQGVKIDVSCENGVCGTCLCNVLDGVPDHRDSYLTDEEKHANDQMLVCCSRAKTPQLVLDL